MRCEEFETNKFHSIHFCTAFVTADLTKTGSEAPARHLLHSQGLGGENREHSLQGPGVENRDTPYKALVERTENNPYKALVERTENTPQWVYIVVKIKFVPMLWRCKFNKFLCYIFKFNYCKLLSMVRRLQMDGRTFYSPLNTMDCYWGVPGPWSQSQFGDGLWDKGGVTLWTCISLDQNKWTSYGHLSC